MPPVLKNMRAENVKNKMRKNRPHIGLMLEMIHSRNTMVKKQVSYSISQFKNRVTGSALDCGVEEQSRVPTNPW